MKQNEDILLHRKITKHSNLMIPFSDHVTAFNFPKQNKELLNTTVTLQYRDRYIADRESVNVPATNRPKDDIMFTKADIKDGDENILFSGNFRILRADISEPYRYIAISLDYKHLFAGKMTKDGEIDTEIYPVSMFQMSEYIGLITTNMYFAKLDLVDAIVLSVNNGEPTDAVIMEYIDKKSNTVRFVFGDECFSPIKGYLDLEFKKQKLDTLEELREYSLNRTITEIMQLREHVLKDINIWSPEEDPVEKDEETDEEISDI